MVQGKGVTRICAWLPGDHSIALGLLVGPLARTLKSRDWKTLVLGPAPDHSDSSPLCPFLPSRDGLWRPQRATLRLEVPGSGMRGGRGGRRGFACLG